MITKDYIQHMARYNRWQNENLYAIADTLPDEERRRERAAFFGSIHKTLNHLMWGDRIWMSRFAGTPRPEGGIPGSIAMHEQWDDLKRDRVAFDATIVDWADGLDPAWLAGDLTWFSGGVGRELTRPKAGLVMHFFNHQTHHRGQVHCMLTQAGVKAHVSDLMAMPA
jgi:uncharacterized damage-inducible protein DinB